MTHFGQTVGRLERGVERALDLLLPPQCLQCGAGVERVGMLCPACWRRTSFLGPPLCEVCGYPFEFDVGEGALCGACTRERPVFDRARAALSYEAVGRDLVLAFKLSDRTYAAPALAGWMVRAGAELLEGADLLAPVPLHRRQLFLRRYNQAALLAQAVGRASGRRVVPDLLVRTRATALQTRLSAAARVENVRGAFRVRPSRESTVADRRIVVIDDVMTTGATVSACARALRKAGAAEVFVLTLARTVRGHT